MKQICSLNVPCAGFSALHKWAGGGVPSQAMELQEMGVDGQAAQNPEELMMTKYFS